MHPTHFSELAAGMLFKQAGSDTVFMKLEGDEGLYVQLTGPAAQRGQVRKKDPTTAVHAIHLDDALANLEHEASFPGALKMRTWIPGETVKVGDSLVNDIHLFAGLYHTTGVTKGNYYSASSNQTFWCTEEVAKVLARWDAVPFVRCPSFKYTTDALLSAQAANAANAG